MKNVICNNKTCQKVLTENMQIEYSQDYNEYYCSLDCATESYLDRARNTLLEYVMDEEKDVEFKNGKLVYKET